MLELLQTGISFNGVIIKVVLHGFVCDAPARAFIACTKTHSGYFSCSKCIEEGDFEGRIVFLNESAPLRDDVSLRNKDQEEHHTGKSILENLPIDMVATFPLDYMHLCCLGVMRKLLWVWIKGPLSCRLSNRQKENISTFLVYLADFIPSEFARKSRSLTELARWKATELRSFLLYIGPVVLKNVLPTRMYNHFLIFHVAIKILATEGLCKEFNQYAKELLHLFVGQAKELYGKEFLSYNVHNLIHLANDVDRFGHLDSFCAFPFENYLQQIKNLLRKHDKPLPQVLRRLNEIQMNELPVRILRLSQIVLKKKQFEGPMVKCCNGKQHQMLLFRSCTIRTKNQSDCYVILHDQRVVRVSNIVKNEEGVFLIGQRFMQTSDSFLHSLKSSKLGFYCVERLYPLAS
jgi:hypothetical protein